MRTRTASKTRSGLAGKLHIWNGGLLLGLLLGMPAVAQTGQDVPLVSGGAGMFGSTNEGFTFAQPAVAASMPSVVES